MMALPAKMQQQSHHSTDVLRRQMGRLTWASPQSSRFRQHDDAVLLGERDAVRLERIPHVPAGGMVGAPLV